MFNVWLSRVGYIYVIYLDEINYLKNCSNNPISIYMTQSSVKEDLSHENSFFQKLGNSNITDPRQTNTRHNKL